MIGATRKKDLCGSATFTGTRHAFNPAVQFSLGKGKVKNVWSEKFYRCHRKERSSRKYIHDASFKQLQHRSCAPLVSSIFAIVCYSINLYIYIR